MLAEKELDSYCQEMRKYLLCSKAKQEDFIFLARFRVSELQQENPDLTYDDLIDFLGEPQELAQIYMESLDDNSKERYLAKKRRQRYLFRILAASLIIFAAWCIFRSTALRIAPEITKDQVIIVSDEKNEY